MSKNKHLTLEDRYHLAELLQKGYKYEKIAEIIGCSVRTIYYEVKRGHVNGTYDPDVAESYKRKNQASKRREPLLAKDRKLAQEIADCILKKHCSPEQIVSMMKEDPTRFSNTIQSYTTIYNAIEQNLIPGVTRKSLRAEETRVYNDGKISLAKWVRDELDIRDGDLLNFEVTDDGKVVFSKVTDHDLGADRD